MSSILKVFIEHDFYSSQGIRQAKGGSLQIVNDRSEVCLMP